MLKTYQGSCHCQAVRFEAEIDLEAGTSRCNCSYCAKRRAWNAIIKPDAFRLLAGADDLGDYQFGQNVGHHRFCRHCGFAPFSDGHLEEIGGDFVSISVNCLDGLSPEDKAAIPVRFVDGLGNNWWNPPAVTAYL
jgi:hypothetical protein